MADISKSAQPLRWAAFLVFLAALAVYLSSAPTGLTWVNDSADGGDLISAALLGGVPHPPGYPLWMLLARPLLHLPVGEPAWRAALLSMISAAIAAAFTTRLLLHLTSPAPDQRWAAAVSAVAAGLLLACAPALWQQAVVVEVYALHAGLSAALLLVLWHWQHNSAPRWGLLAGVMFGLGLSNHLTTIWLLPAVLAAMPCPRRAAVAAFLGGLLVGLSPYLALAVAATGAAPVNWAAPGTVRSLLWLVSGELYRGYVLAVPLSFWPVRLAAWAAALWHNLLPWGLAAAVWGFVVLFSTQRRLAIGWLASLLPGLVWALSYNTSDSLLSWLPGWVMLAVAAGMGLYSALRAATARCPARVVRVLGVMALLLVLLPAALRWPQQTLRHDHTAERFYQAVLAEVAPNAVIVTVGDRATFALWYGRYARHLRSDVTLVSRDLWALPGYRALLISQHPALVAWNDASWEALAREIAATRPVYLVQAGLPAAPGWTLIPYP